MTRNKLGMMAAVIAAVGLGNVDVPMGEPCQPNEPPPDTRPQRAKSSHKQNARKAQKRKK